MADAHIIVALIAAPFIGSFISVLVVRLPEGEGVVLGRSMCPSCGHKLSAADLVPILSWLFLRGKCRHCGAPISLLYPELEIAAALVALWSIFVVPQDMVWPTCILGWSLLALAVIDFRSFVLPDVITLPLIPAGLAVAWWIDPARLPHHAIGAAVGYAVFAIVALSYRWLRGREGLGAGDAKLLAAAGAWVSWEGLASVVMWGALFGLAYAVMKSLTGTRLTATFRVSFGTYLAAAIWLVWLFGPVSIV